MAFGKRLSLEQDRTPTVVEQTCVRCCGTGRVRERGNRLLCKSCKGTGRIAVTVQSKA